MVALNHSSHCGMYCWLICCFLLQVACQRLLSGAKSFPCLFCGALEYLPISRPTLIRRGLEWGGFKLIGCVTSGQVSKCCKDSTSRDKLAFDSMYLVPLRERCGSVMNIHDDSDVRSLPDVNQ